MYLISPKQLVAISILETVPYTQELGDTVYANMICILFCLVPRERRSEIQQTHVGLWEGTRKKRENVTE